MRLISRESAEFTDIVDAVDGSDVIGTYQKGSFTRTIRVTRHVVIIELEEDPETLGFHEAPSVVHAHQLAYRMLEREQTRRS